MIHARTHHAWAILWRQKSKLDGTMVRFIGCPVTHGPLMFPTRAAARAHVRARYGYIATRADLRREPHGWTMPRAVRVVVEVRAL